MKNIALLLAAFLAISTASAQVSLSFDDAGIDYLDTGTTQAYLTLDASDGGLQMSVSDAPSASVLPPLAFAVPDLGRTDLFGAAIGAELGDVDDFSLLTAGTAVEGFQGTHLGASVYTLSGAYEAALEAEGIAVTVQRSVNGNLATITSDDGALRIHLHRVGGDVTVWFGKS